jgi:glucose-6-phosphate 1-dehydrogenase
MENIENNSILVIFGATGDLATHYLFPALLHLEKDGLLPKDLRIVPVSRRNWTTDDFSKWLNGELKTKPDLWKKFSKRFSFVSVDFSSKDGFIHLAKLLKDIDTQSEHACFNRLFYYAVEPKFFFPLSTELKKSGLLTSCTKHNRLTRVLIEKPFGTDLKSAQKLNKLLTSFFSEEQIYRIDHYLGKETVQNLMVARFANVFFEPVWNREFIDRIEIDMFEEESVGTRLEFYNQTGALKDVVQNHLLNILAVLAMEKPKDLSSKAIRQAKAVVLNKLIPESAKTITNNVVRAQYASGPKTKSFLQEGGNTNIETFIALKVYLASARFKNVPFIIRTGKRLAQKQTEVRVVFKHMGDKLFAGQKVLPNVLTFRIQPEERVSIKVNNKQPGFGMDLHPAQLDFSYTSFKKSIPLAYERLLLDFIQRDQRLFLESGEVEASWKYIDSVVNNLGKVKMDTYMPFSEGLEIK